MSLDLGIIVTADCVNIPAPGVDSRCSDPAFALANPDLCPIQPQLILKPASAVLCTLGEVKLGAFLVVNGQETDVTDSTVFASNNLNIALVGATSGAATGAGPGVAYITGTYNGMTASSELTVMSGSACCFNRSVAFEILLDVTKSMQQNFGATFGSRLDFAKYASTQFISKVNNGKDKVGVMTFTGAVQAQVSSISSDKTSATSAVANATQTNDTTSFYKAISAAITNLNSASADEKVLIVISDGEDEDPSDDSAATSPLLLAQNFKQNGGLVFCLGCRASATAAGFQFLSTLSTGGFFVNGTPDNFSDAVNYFTGLMGYVCSGGCTPDGDVVQGQGVLNYTGFNNWDVIGGNVDLIGNGFFDLLPGNGLYVDLGGTSAPHAGLMKSKSTFPVVAGREYRLTVTLAGNQVTPDGGASVEVKIVGTLGTPLIDHFVVSDYMSGFTDYSFSWKAAANDNVYIEIQQTDLIGVSSPTPRYVNPSNNPQSTLTMITGCGSPEGVVTATLGVLYWDSCGKTYWIKDSVSGSTGWRELLG